MLSEEVLLGIMSRTCRFIIVAVGLLTGFAIKVAPPPAFQTDAFMKEIDWETAGRESADILSRYIEIPSINPPAEEQLEHPWAKEDLLTGSTTSPPLRCCLRQALHLSHA